MVKNRDRMPLEKILVVGREQEKSGEGDEVDKLLEEIEEAQNSEINYFRELGKGIELQARFNKVLEELRKAKEEEKLDFKREYYLGGRDPVWVGDRDRYYYTMDRVLREIKYCFESFS